MSILLQDIRFALRQLLKQPAFSVVAVLSLALWIAASVTLFSVIYRVLLRPTPYRNADRVVRFVDLNDKTETEYTPPIYRDQIRELKKSHSIDDVVEMDERYLADRTFDVPRDTDVVLLSGNAFPFFGVPAMVGRTFLPSDAPSGQAPQPVAVLTYQYWRRRFNGNPAIVGQTLRLDNRSYTILGVMPRSFNWWDSDLYLPLDTSDPSRQAFMTVLLLKPGVSKTQAMAEIHPFLEQMIREHPHSGFEQMNIQLMSTADRYRRSLGKALYVLLAAVLLLLVIGCVNVSILLVARGVKRRREFAVRLALGASSARVVRQLLTESLVLGFAGTVFGVIATYRTTTLVAPLLPWQLFTHGLEILVPLPVLGFAIALAILTGVFAGLFPAVRILKPEISPILQANSRHATANIPGRRLYSILIAGQIAFAMVLLTTALSTMSSFRLLQQTDLGYDPNHVADFPIPIHPGSYTTWESRANYLRQLRDRVGQVPGVVSASLGVIGPPASDWDFAVEILGQNATSSQSVNVNFVDSQFFQLLRIPLLQGRLWDEAETARGARLALVNQEFVRRYFPNRDVLGHSVRVPDLVNHPPGVLAAAGSNEWAQIIAVVGDARNNGLEDPVKPEIYFPYSLYMIDWIQVLVRAQGDPMSLETDVRRQIANVNPGQQVSDPVFSLTNRLEQESAWARSHLLVVLSSIFSVLALILTSIGLYSVISYTVAQRVTEFGIRMALGAKRRHIGIPASRATSDIDFAIAVESWDKFHRMRNALLATGEFVPSKVEHRLFFNATDIPIDLIPFGGVAEDDTIAWPPAKDTVMTVAGFEDAMAASIQVQVSATLTIPVVSLAALAMLKIFAWQDRKTTDKDALDLYRVISTYADTGNEDRLYDPVSPHMEKFNYDPEFAGAALAGEDSRMLSSAATVTKLRTHLVTANAIDDLAERIRLPSALARNTP